MIADAPAQFKDARRLYMMHTCFTFVSRMWDMAVTLLLAELTDNSLFIVAVAGLMSSLSIFVLSPYLGRIYDEMGRLAAVKLSLVVKVVAVSAGYMGCAVLLFSPHYHFDGTFGPMLYAIPLFCAVADVSFAMVAMGIQKDWIVVLSGGDSDWLSDMNSIMTQIDLASKSLAPALTGILFDYLSYGTSAVILMFLNAAITAAFFWFLSDIFDSFPALWSRNTNTNEGAAVPSPATADSTNPFAEDDEEKEPLRVTTEGSDVREVCFEEAPSTLSSDRGRSGSDAHQERRTVSFLSSGCAGTMVGYSVLYFTVLSFGSLMTVYLKWAGMSVSWIGTLRGIGALTGFIGAFAFPSVRGLLGLRTTGVYSIWYQFVFVAFAASSFFWASPLAVTFIISVAVLFSRTGLWMFDLAATQIAQETIPERSRGKINGQWRSITACFDTLTYLVAIVFSRPEQFDLLAVLSALSVLLAAAVYTATEAECCQRPSDKEGSEEGGGPYAPIPDSPTRSVSTNNSTGTGKSSRSSTSGSQKSVELVIPVLDES